MARSVSSARLVHVEAVGLLLLMFTINVALLRT